MLVLLINFRLLCRCLYRLCFFLFHCLGCLLAFPCTCSPRFFLPLLALNVVSDPLGIDEGSALGCKARLAEGVHELAHILAFEPLADPH